MSHLPNIDHDEVAFNAGVAQGHQEAMQEVLGYLRKEYQDYQNLIHDYPILEHGKRKSYTDYCAFILIAVEDLFSQKESEMLQRGI